MRKSITNTIGTLLSVVAFSFGTVAAEKPANAQYWDSVYSGNRVIEMEVTLTRDAWDTMPPPSRGPGPEGRAAGSGYPYVRAELMIDGRKFEEAGLRFKGNSSYRYASDEMKKPFKIDLNRFVKGQKLQGRSKLNLSNAFLDPAFMKEKLGYELYGAAGLPTPGVGWANVTLSVEGLVEKKSLGLYVLIEQVDKRFIESRLGAESKDSLLMKPEGVGNWDYLGDPSEDYGRYGIKFGGENEELFRRFVELIRLIERAPMPEFEREIEQRMDLEQFAGYLAATSLLVNIDSYIGMQHNYYLLMDRADGKLRMFPWDVNETFGTFLFVDGVSPEQAPERLVHWSIDRPWVADRRLPERLFKTERFPRLYRATLERLVKDEFTEEKLFKRIAEYERVIAPYLNKETESSGLEGLHMGIEGDESGRNRAVRRPILAIKPFIEKRIESVRAQLAGESEGEVFRRSGR